MPWRVCQSFGGALSKRAVCQYRFHTRNAKLNTLLHRSTNPTQLKLALPGSAFVELSCNLARAELPPHDMDTLEAMSVGGTGRVWGVTRVDFAQVSDQSDANTLNAQDQASLIEDILQMVPASPYSSVNTYALNGLITGQG